MTISATDILVPVCSKIPLLYLLTQKVAQKFGYVLGIKKELYVFWLARRSQAWSHPLFYRHLMQVERHQSV